MNINDFAPGQIVQLDIKLDNISGSYDAKVALIYKSLLLLEPIYVGGALVGFPKSAEVNLTYTEQSTYFIWKKINIRTIIFKNHHYHAAEIIGDAETGNRRNNFRVYIGEDMPVTYFTEEGPRSMNCLIKDISETGFAFICDDDTFQLERTVRLNIPQKDRSVIHISAKIVRSVPMDDGVRTLYGCHFIERNPKLSGYLMKIQRLKQHDKLN